jgi:hypothetical protein
LAADCRIRRLLNPSRSRFLATLWSSGFTTFQQFTRFNVTLVEPQAARCNRLGRLESLSNVAFALTDVLALEGTEVES